MLTSVKVRANSFVAAQRNSTFEVPGHTRTLRSVAKRPTVSCHSTSGAPGPSEAEADSSAQQQWERVLFFESGNAVSLTSRKRNNELWPEHDLTREAALDLQMKALQRNNDPYPDHGIEVMYRFGAFDPFNPRTLYFGRSFDLGQFERFRRIMRSQPYTTLLEHQNYLLLSSLEVGEHTWVARVQVTGAPHGDVAPDVAVYEFTMVQRVGGVHDGYWFTLKCEAEGNNWEFLKGHVPGRTI